MTDQEHGKPSEDMECMCCMDDIDGENYVEYRTGEAREWLPAKFCETCIETLVKRQWPIYEESLGKATCKAQQKRMLGEGPPTHVHDKEALPCPEGESVHSLWYMQDKEIHSALLEGAPQGKARQIWWDEKLAFQFEEDEEEQGEEDSTPVGTANASVHAQAQAQPIEPVNVDGNPKAKAFNASAASTDGAAPAVMLEDGSISLASDTGASTNVSDMTTSTTTVTEVDGVGRSVIEDAAADAEVENFPMVDVLPAVASSAQALP